MRDENNKIKEMALYEKFLDKAKKVKEKKNLIYYISIILFDICFLSVISIIYSNNNDVLKIKDILINLDYRLIFLLFGLVVVILLLRSFPDYFMMAVRTKKHKYFSVLSGDIQNVFYSGVTMLAESGDSVYVKRLTDSGIGCKFATDIVFVKRLAEKIAKVIFWLSVIFATIWFVFDSVYVWVFVISVIAFIGLFLLTMYLLFMGGRKEKYVVIVGKLVKLLYKLKMIKDYESVYNYIIERLAVYNSILQNNKKILLLSVICCITRLMVSSLMLVVVFWVADLINWDLLLEILFKFALISVVVDVLPLPKGVAVYEVLFLLVFGGGVLSASVVWALIVYRMLDYYIYLPMVGFVVLVDKLSTKISMSKRENKKD